MHPPRLSLFIATAPRSGSWLLAEGLRDLEVAGRAEEFFNVNLDPLYRGRWGLPSSAPYDHFLARVIREGTTPNGVFAVKVHWFQFAYLLRRLRDLKGGAHGACEVGLLERDFGAVRLVYLEREDTLRQAISWARAIVTRRWWSIDGAAALPVPVAVGYDFEMVKHLYHLLSDYKQYWRDWFDQNDVRPLEITYERLADHYEETIKVVLSALGVPCPREISQPALRRQADMETENWVRCYRDSWINLFDTEPRSR